MRIPQFNDKYTNKRGDKKMVWFIAIISAVNLAVSLILFSYFDGQHLRMRAELDKQDRIITDLCTIIDKNFLKLANELNNTKEE